MPSFTSLFVCLLAAVSILAAPVSELDARGRSKHSVCGVKFVIKDVADKCPLDSVFTLKDKSTVVKETKTKVSGYHGVCKQIGTDLVAETSIEGLATRYLNGHYLSTIH